MIYVKSVLFGLGGAVLAAALWITVTFVLPLYVPYAVARIRGTGGMSARSIGSGSIVIAALIGFVIVFAWEWHRLRVAP